MAALAPAQAAAAVGAPVRLGDGDRPNVTVEDDGTAHIAWTGVGANSKELDYCRLPRGATACAPKTVIAAPGDSLSKPLAFSSGGTAPTIHVVSYRYGLAGPSFSAVMVFRSTDGGATFDAGENVGSIAPNDFEFGPGDTLSAVTAADACGLCYQAWPLTGGAASGTAVLSTDHPYVGTVTMVDPQTPLAVFATGGGDGQVRRYGGTGDVNDAANWTPPVDLGTLDYPHLVSGPGGLLMIAQDALSGAEMQTRRFDGTTFGTRVAITTGTRADHAAEDASGRTHVVAGKFSAGPTGAALFYASSDDGTAWEKEQVDFPGLPANMRVAIAPDHFGAVVGTFASGQPGVFASSIGPSAAVPTTTKFVDATVISGTVLIQVPPSKTFAQLRRGDVIPIGSVVDATKGRVRITIALPNGTLQSTDFFQGIFTVTQAKTGLATMVLGGGSFKSCPRGARSGSVAAKPKVIRQLWGEGAGQFRTKGRFATAAIRGTTWDTVDRCDGTLIKVTKGRILVTDLKTKKKITLKAGKSYLAKA